MELLERQETERTLDRLPELPPEVEVPDDISALRGKAAPKPTAGGIRWMRWLVAAAILVVGAVGGLSAWLLLDSSDPAEDTVVEAPVVVPEAAEAAEATVDYMAKYGTDNPVILDENAVPGITEIEAPIDFMAKYGTDNPVFVEVEEPSFMQLYGTDNPVFVDGR